MKKIIFSSLFLLLCIITIAQEKIKYNGKNGVVEFTISPNEFYTEYAPQKILLIQSLAKDGFAKISDRSAIISIKNLQGDFLFRKNKLKEQITTTLEKVEPVLLFSDGTKEIANGKINLRLKPGINIKDILKGYDFIDTLLFASNNLYTISSKTTATAELFGIVEKLQADKRVEFAEPNFIREFKHFTNDPFFSSQWAIKNNGYLGIGTPGADMKVEQAWNYATGSGIKVAIIDEGVDLTHPDLQANLLAGFDATGNNSNGAPSGNDAHGTACAGIVGAVANNNIGIAGIAYNAKILPVRIAKTTVGSPIWTTDAWAANGINWAWQNGADVLSNSWGGGSYSSTIATAITNAVTNGRNGKGSVVLFASGNNNGAVSFPATLDNVIAVGASSMCDERKSFTSCDGEQWGGNYGAGLDVMAPGVKIYTTDIHGSAGYNSGDYSPDFNGTSSATPNAAGVVALILSVNANLTGQQARYILESSCDKVGGYNYQSNVTGQPNGTWSNDAGYGRVNASKAVCTALTQTFSIRGNNIVCNSSVYSIPTLPSGASVTWSIPGNAGPVLQLSPNNPLPNQLTITNQKWYSVSTILQATVSNLGCGISNTSVRPISIVNDNSTSAVAAFPYYQEACSFYNVPHPSQSGTIYSNSSPAFVNQGCMVYVNLGDMTGKTVSLQSGSAQPLYWGITGGTSYFPNSQNLIFQLPLGSGGIPFTFQITGDGACYTRTLLFFSYSGNSRYAYAATPNPVTNQLFITVKEDEKYLYENKLSSTKGNLQLTFNVYDVNTNSLQLTERSSIGSLQHQLNVSKLKKGYYVLQIVNGKEIQSIKFFKE